MESVGELLSRERKSKKVRIEEISSVTRISSKYIRALEENNFQVLPSEPFVKGYIDAYARCLGLDAAKVLSLYKEQVRREGTPPPSADPLKDNTLVQVEMPLGRRKKPSLTVLALGLLVSLLVTWVGYRLYLQEDIFPTKRAAEKTGPLPAGGADRAPSPYVPPANDGFVPDLPEGISPAAPPSPATPAGVAKTREEGGQDASALGREVALKEEKAGLKPLTLTVVARAETWLRVEIDQGEKREMILAAGRTRSWKAQEGFVLSIGNVAGTAVQLDGKDLALPPATGNVLRNFRITRELIR